jgi:PAS domain S-box-containing protein
MVADAEGKTTERSALVVQRDTRVRLQLCDVLERHGYAVEACGSFAEGRMAYRGQRLVVTTTERDVSAPGGFIAWLRDQPVNEGEEPFILAVGDAGTAESAPVRNRQWNALLPLPLHPVQVQERMAAVEQWMARRTRGRPVTPVPGVVARPLQLGVLGHGDADGRWRALADHAPLALALCDAELRYLAVNERWRREFRLAGSAAEGLRHDEVFADLGRFWEEAAERAWQGVPQRFAEDVWSRADGTTHRVRWEVRPWPRADGSTGGLVIACEILRGEEAGEGRIGENLGRALWEESHAPVLVLDLRGTIREANAAALHLVGDPAPEALRERCFWEAFVHESRREAVKIEFLAAAQESREQGRFAFPPSWAERLRIGVRLRKVAWAVTPWRDGSGRLQGVVCAGVVLPEGGVEPWDGEGTESSRGISAELLDHVPFGLVLLDAGRNTRYANREHRSLLGLDVEDFADIEHWVAAAAARPDVAEETARSWRETVWRKQGNLTLTLRAVDRSLREIEFRPRPTVDGGMILTLFDVTGRRRDEEARRSSEAKFRSLFQGADIGIALEDSAGLLFDVNPAFEAITGAGRAEVRRTGMRDWIHPEDRLRAEEALEASRRRGPGEPGEGTVELRLRTAAGGEAWARVGVCHVADPQDRMVFTAYFVSDVNAERAALGDLEATRAEHRALLRAVPDLILLVDAETEVLDLIPAASGILVADAAGAAGRMLDELLPGLEGLSRQLVGQTLASRALSIHEFAVDLGEGFSRRFEARFVAAGERRCVVVVQDVTTLHQARAVLRRHALTFEHCADGVVITDAGGQIVDWNPAAERLFGRGREEIVGQPLAVVFAPQDRSGFNRRVALALAQDGAWAGVMAFERPDGTTGRCEVRYVAAADEAGQTAYILGTNREV